DVAVSRVDIEAVVELDFRLISRNDALRLGKSRRRRRIVGSAEHPIGPEVVVLQNDLVIAKIQRDGAICRIEVPNCAYRLKAGGPPWRGSRCGPAALLQRSQGGRRFERRQHRFTRWLSTIPLKLK